MTQPELFCPYVGLQPYTEAECDYFFGRERDQRIIVSNLYAAPLTVLYGASGVGKSSVLLAGVVPRLRAASRTAVVVFREWQDATFLRALKAACITAVEKANGKPLSLDANLPFDELLAQAAQILNGSVVILLDQFEEYFLYHAESRADDSFDAEFARAVNRDDVNAAFLIALREDGLSKLDRFRTRIPNLLGNTLRLEHLDTVAAEDALCKPLNVYNSRYAASVGIEDELINEVLDSVKAPSSSETSNRETRIETPFLQLVMTRLWDEEMKAGSSTLRIGTLQRLGGAEKIVRTHLDRVMERLTESDRNLSAVLFDRLVTPSGAKIAQRVDDLVAYAALPTQQVTDILKTLADARVLRPIAPPPDHPSATRYEIFHDVLAPAVSDWHIRYLQVQEMRQVQDRLKREREEAERQLQLSYERQRATRMRWMLIGLSGLLLLIVALAFIAIQQGSEATQRGNEAATQGAIARTEAARAQTEAPRAQTEAARAQTEAARAQTQLIVAQTQAANVLELKSAFSTIVPQGTTTPDPAVAAARATATAAVASAVQVSKDWCPCATIRPITANNFQVGRSGQKAKAVVLQIVSGPLALVFPSVFNNPIRLTSAHFGIGKDGTIEQYVSISDTAYGNGLAWKDGQWYKLLADGSQVIVNPTWQDIIPNVNPNLYTVSITLDGYSQDQWTPQMYDATNRLLLWLARQLDITYIPHRTLIGHSEIDPVGRANSPGPNVDYERIANETNAQKAAVAMTWMPINTEGVLYKFAQSQNLGYPQTDEFEFTFGNSSYAGQVFNSGIVYVKKGDWGNVKWVEKTTASETSESRAALAKAKTLTWMSINPDSVLYQFAQKSNLGYPQTIEFEYTVGSDTYIGQVFTSGIVYVKKGSSDVKFVKKP